MGEEVFPVTISHLPPPLSVVHTVFSGQKQTGAGERLSVLSAVLTDLHRLSRKKIL